MAQAQALVEWHRAHRFCPRCGGGLVVGGGGYVLTCESCGRQQFPRTDPAVIMLVTDGDRALLGRQAAWPAGRYSTLAGFVDPGESLEQAVAREVMEEAGVEVTDVTYFGNQPWPFPSSLMIGFFARAVTTDIEVDGDELEAARWFTREEMRAGGRGRHPRAARRHLDQPVAHRGLVRRPRRRTAPRLLVTAQRPERLGPEAARIASASGRRAVDSTASEPTRGEPVLKKSLVAAALLTVTACGVTEVDVPGLEENIVQEVKEQADEDVTADCPDQVDWEKGSSFDCDVAFDDGSTAVGAGQDGRRRGQRRVGPRRGGGRARQLSEASLARTSLMPGLVCAVPSEYTSVGTVWLPRLWWATIEAASGCFSMSTTSKSMPSRSICDLSRWQ